MADEQYYMTLSKRFEQLAGDSKDPLLADSYRALAERYRALDFWHRRFADRYEGADEVPGDAEEQH